jgi:hypothetical protein
MRITALLGVLDIAGPLQLGAYKFWFNLHPCFVPGLEMSLKCIGGTNRCEYDQKLKGLNL